MSTAVAKVKKGEGRTVNKRFGSFVELNAWLGQRCRALWDEVRHPEHDQFSVAEMLENERPHLMPMPMPAPFDGYVENPARVSNTCLVVGGSGAQPLLGAVRAGRAGRQQTAARPSTTGSNTSR